MTPEQTQFRENLWLEDREGGKPNVLFSLLVAQQSTFGPVEPTTSTQPQAPYRGRSEVYAYKTRYQSNTNPGRFL